MAEPKSESGFVLVGPQIEAARWLAVRSALSLELKGMRRSRGRSARRLAEEIVGASARTPALAYDALDALITERLGAQFSRPRASAPDAGERA